jgi:hypothetical protein
MKGLEQLYRLPDDIKNKIISKYSSLEEYYQFVFNLYETDRYWYTKRTEESRLKRQEIQSKIYDMEDELVEFGLDFDNPVISEISSDHGEKVLNEFLTRLS